jgi:hypothetical protein
MSICLLLVAHINNSVFSGAEGGVYQDTSFSSLSLTSVTSIPSHVPPLHSTIPPDGLVLDEIKWNGMELWLCVGRF